MNHPEQQRNSDDPPNWKLELSIRERLATGDLPAEQAVELLTRRISSRDSRNRPEYAAVWAWI